MNVRTIKRYLETANYTVIPVSSYGVKMVAGPDETLGVYHVINTSNGPVEKVISQEANKLCRFRDKLNDLIKETLDDIEIKITAYLFYSGQQTISPQFRMKLSMKGITLVNINEPENSLNRFFPRFRLRGQELIDYEAYVEYLQTVAKFLNSEHVLSDISPEKKRVEVAESETIPLFRDLENIHTHITFEIKDSFIINNPEPGNT